MKSIKGDDESFSDIVLRVIPKKKSLAEFAGRWKDRSSEWDKIKKDLAKERKNPILRDY